MLISAGERRRASRATPDGFRREHDGYGCQVVIGCMLLFWVGVVLGVLWACGVIG